MRSLIGRAVLAAGMTLLAGVSSAQENFAEIFSVDFSKDKNAVEHNGQKARLLKADDVSAHLGRVDTSGMDIDEHTRFMAEVEIAGAKSSPFHIRAIPYLDKKQKLDSVRGGIFGQPLTDEFKTYKGEFSISEDPNYYSDKDRKISALLMLAYRGKSEGDAWVKSFKLHARKITPLKTEDLVAGLKKSLVEDGFLLEEKDGRLEARKSDERRYFSLALRKTYSDKESFDRAAFLGATYLRSEFKQPLFPAGPYVYGMTDQMRRYAEIRGVTLEGLFDAFAKDVVAHGGNTIYYSNLASDPETFKLAAKTSLKNGVRIFGQLNRDLYLRPQKGPEYYETVTKPAASKILPQYKGLEGVLGWMGCEEAAEEHMPMLMEYRKLCRELNPTHPLYTLHNHLKPFQADTKNYPEWYGFDRYRFRCISPENVISTPREMASLLSKELSAFYEEAAKRGRPLIFVGQSYGTNDEIKTEKMEKRTGFREVSPGVWRGWCRYMPPENGMFLQSWLAVSEGAKGLLWYSYIDEPNSNEVRLVDEKGGERRIWKELGACFKEMTPLFPLIMSWHKEGVRRGSSDSPWVRHNAFVREFDKERYYVVVNTRIGEWDKDSPMRPSNDTELYFDENGLAGYKKSGPLTFKFQPEGGAPLWDVLTGRRLDGDSENRYNMTIGPGRGVVLMQGSESELKSARKSLNLK